MVCRAGQGPQPRRVGSDYGRTRLENLKPAKLARDAVVSAEWLVPVGEVGRPRVKRHGFLELRRQERREGQRVYVGRVAVVSR